MYHPPNWPGVKPPNPPPCVPHPKPPERQDRMKHFHFWCQHVLPLVYDDSLSYYEVLEKCVDYINNLIKQDNTTIDRQDELEEELAVVQQWISDYDTSFAEAIIARYMATMVMFGLTADGRLCAYIPPSWKTLNFATTGKEINVPGAPFGCLTILY